MAQARRPSSKTRTRSKPAWADVRSNVQYEGCYPDYAYLHPEYEDAKYYHVPRVKGEFVNSPGGQKQLVRHRDQLIPPGPVDPRLPPPRTYKAYLDGPARVIPSIDRVLAQQPESRTLDQALRRCYDMARGQNKRYFALQNGGRLCLATNSRDFMQWGKLPDGACQACGHRCPAGQKPCGQRCVAHDRRCPHQQHQPCASDAPETGTKGGGYFTNSVFRIKDMEAGEDPPSTTPLPDEYARFRYPAPEVTDEMACPAVPNNFFDLSPTQLFMQQYFNPQTPVKGMLIYKSAGAGKTCEALNVIGNFMGQWRIFWVTRQSLRDTPLKNLYRDICQLRLRELIDAPEPITLASGQVLARTKDEKIAFIRSERGPAVLKRYGIEIEKQRILSYDSFVKMIAGHGAEGQKLQEQQLAGARHGDLGYRTLFVFDEAHNLISPGLPAEERQDLDAVCAPVTLGGRTFSRRRDVYGDHVAHPEGELVGRDLIPALFWQSYQLSKKDSAKCLILTGTPMSTSPAELFWLLNLTLEVPAQRLSLNVHDYYDASTMRLRDEAVVQFARAAHGRISFLDITQNPTQFARKIFFDRMNVVLHDFHQKIINDAVEKEKAHAEKAGEKLDWTKMVTLYQNLGLMARTKGAFYDEETLAQYDREVARLKHWDPVQERQYQQELYAREVSAAKRVFKLDVRAADQQGYARKVEQYRKWADKHAAALRPLDAPTPDVQDVMDAQGNLLTREEWLRKNQADHVAGPSSDADVPKEVRKRFATLVQRKTDYEQKLADGKKPRRPQLSELLKTDGTAKTLLEFYRDVWVTTHVKRRDESAYAQLAQSYEDFRRSLSEHALRSKQRRGRREALPAHPAGVDEVMDDWGQLLPLEEWFTLRLAPKRAKKAKKRYTAEETKYLRFLIQDPASGLMRLRTQDEFVQVADPHPTLSGPETRKNVSLLMWHKNFDARVARQLLPFYAPRIHACVQMIVEREQQAQQELGHGLKHTVFTFSTAGKGGDASNYGARAVASAFHAYQDLFRVLLVYKEDETGRFVLHHDLPSQGPDDHRWGVAVLCSKDLPNIYVDQYGGNQKVEYNFKVIGATQAAFNDARNRYGDRIKVLLMDGAYTEGVEAYDDNVGHFLNEGLSPPQLEQASSRSVRYCRSKHIPFFKGVGGFMEMYFYAQAGLNEQMLQHVPYEEQLNLNMMDVFKEMSAQFSIDYWLNLNVNHFRPVYQGQLTEYYDKWNRAYLVTKSLERSERNGAARPDAAARTVDYRFIVDPDSMVTRIGPGMHVTDPAGRLGVVTHWQPSTRQFQVAYTADRSEASWTEAELRLAPGQTVDFVIPYGTDLAKKVMNIGNYNVMHPSELTRDMVSDIQLPEHALQAVSTAFRNHVLYVLLGLVSLLRLVVQAGGAGVPVRVVTPPPDEGDAVPSMSNFAMRWTFAAMSGERDLRYPYLAVQQFLAPKEGVSLMFLTLQAQPGQEDEHDHVNVLLYVPAWGTVERFDPMGYVAHAYDSVVLDARLHDTFQKLNPQLLFMSSAETCPLFGLQRLQLQERPARQHRLDPASYCTVFALFYMHMRILYAAQHLKTYPREKRTVFPLQFQRGLVRAMQDQAGVSLTEYIRNYAELAVTSKAFVSAWEQYREHEPFWANTARMVTHLQELASRISTVKRHVADVPTSTPTTGPMPAGPTWFERLHELSGFLW